MDLRLQDQPPVERNILAEAQYEAIQIASIIIRNDCSAAGLFLAGNIEIGVESRRNVENPRIKPVQQPRGNRPITPNEIVSLPELLTNAAVIDSDFNSIASRQLGLEIHPESRVKAISRIGVINTSFLRQTPLRRKIETDRKARFELTRFRKTAVPPAAASSTPLQNSISSVEKFS